MLDLYAVLKLVEQEMQEMHKRQEHVISSYQQQTREEIVKKIITANESILESAEAKVKELNAVEQGKPYIIATNRHVLYIGVKRFIDESSLSISIDPLIYPSQFNLKFILDEPCVALHNISASTGIVSINKRTVVRAVDQVEQVTSNDIDGIVRLWLNEYDESDAKRIIKGIAALRSLNTLVDYLLTSGKHTRKSTIYLCNDHDDEPMHKHDKMIARDQVRGVIRHILDV
jgi:hypothetical protein